ncbi:choline dehydrogenase [Rhodococcus sp. 27YEA15]|uniref:mycofactocin dehydrogenase MftG n=1 Tax=Rhodococcus sp. 27YEA15 TaxID=3156259 RepID=UPI003C7ECCB4
MTEPGYSDYLIVGGGTCGSVLAARLSEDPDASVRLLEAGPGYTSPADLPAALADPYRLPVGPGSDYTVVHPVDLMPGRAGVISRGRVLGGSGAVNGAYFARSTPGDFERWPASWSYDEVLPYFRRSETDHDFGGEFHGDRGPVQVRRRDWDRLRPFSSAFRDAALSAGFADDPDKNAPGSTGVGRVPLNILDDRRISTAVGYLLPVIGRANLRIDCGVRVVRIVFSGTRAVGVDAVIGGTLQRVFGRHVVVSAGAIASPHLLMNSGIGRAEDLAVHGIEVVADLPGVGSGFSDHPEISVPYRFSAPQGRDAKTPVLETILNDGGIEFRPYTAAFSEMIDGLPPMDHTLGIVLMSPSSRGSIRLAPHDPTDSPLVHYNYLGEARDRRDVRDGLQVAGELLEMVAATGLVERPSIEYTDAWIESKLGTSLHLSGSCAMGEDPDSGAVVHPATCGVYGTTGLSVVDTSIFPQVPSRGPHATAVMVAERAAALLRGDENSSAGATTAM